MSVMRSTAKPAFRGRTSTRVAAVLIASAALAAVAALAAACGGSAAPQPTTTVTVTSSAPASQSATPATSPSASPTAQGSPGAATTSLKVYFLRRIGGTQPEKGPFVAAAARIVPATPAPARAAVEALLAGPLATERAVGMSTTIPAGTALRGLSISGGVATVDLSGAFGAVGSTSSSAALAQVVFTLTQFPSVSKGVVIKVVGKAATVAGVAVTGPQQRSDYESVTPPIFVDGPAAFGVVAADTLHVTGTADVFEATFRAKLVGGGSTGTVAGPVTVTASSGSGTRGVFDFSLPLAKAGASGTLVVWDVSMKDGSALHTVRIPLAFTH